MAIASTYAPTNRHDDERTTASTELPRIVWYTKVADATPVASEESADKNEFISIFKLVTF